MARKKPFMVKKSNPFKLLICLLCLALSCSLVNAQTDSALKAIKKIELGLELQAYPAGLIPCFSANIFWRDNLTIRLRTGFNFIDRQDFSPFNDHEKGFGYGASIGLIRNFEKRKREFVFGPMFDVWSTNISWEDNLQSTKPTQGKSYTLVIQPWVQAGYLWRKRNFSGGITLGFGREINAITIGEKVGEGWIGSLSIQSNFALKKQ